jgi:ribosomal protein S15P/S13E
MTEVRDPVTGLTGAEHDLVAEELYAARDQLGGDEEDAIIEPEVRSVISVRFNRTELGSVEAAAKAAGLALSTYIRNAALEAAGMVDVDAARRDLASLIERIHQLRKHLGDAA